MWGFFLYIFCYVGIFAYFLRFTVKNRLRYMWIFAYLFISLYVYFSTEILSLFNSLNRTGVLISWGTLSAIIAVLLLTTAPVRKSWGIFLNHHPVEMIWHGIQKNKFLSLALFWFLLITFLGAILYAPNTYDAMTYHMTRIMHWLQNENVSYFATNDQRLNFQLPLAEYIIMHIQLLLTKDYFANLIQWNAFITTLVTASLIASELNLNRKAQLLVCFVTATVPNVIFQAQSTQNDLAVGSFLLLFVLFMLKLRRKITFSTIVLAGLSMGLALATKGTAFLYIGILGIAFAFWILLNSGKLWLLNALKCSVIVIIGLFLLIPIFYRNYTHYHAILPANPEKNSNSIYIVSDRNPMELVRTFVRSMSLHWGTPSVQWNNNLQNFLEWFFGPEYLITQNTNQGKIPPQITFSLHEDCIGNLLHLVLFFLAAAIILFSAFYKKRHCPAKQLQKDISCFTILALLVMIFMFTSLCYSPWRARYHVPLFCLFSVSIAYCIHFYIPRWFRGVFYILLFCNGIYFLHSNEAHPIGWSKLTGLTVEKLKRQKNEHLTDRNTFDSLNRLKDFLQNHNIREIMFHNTSNQRDYPIFKFLGTATQRNGIRVQRVDCNTEKIENYNIPYLLLVPWDTSLKTLPPQNSEIIYSDNGILLFDLRRKADNTVSIPLEHSFSKYSPVISFDGAYEQFVPHPWVKPRTNVEFSLKKEAENDILLYLRAYVTPVPGQYHYRFYFQGKLLQDFLVPGGGSFDFKVVLPQKMLRENKKVKLELIADGIVSPAEAKLSSDTRRLALRPMKMMLYYAGPDTNIPILLIKNPKAKINLGQDKQSYHLIEGFAELENSGIWTSGNKAVLQIAIPQSMQGRQLFCKISGHVFLHQDKKKRQFVKIFGQKKLFAQKEFLFPNAASPIYFTIPPEISKAKTIFLTFVLPDAASPKSLGISSDARNLAYYLKSLQLADNQNELFFATALKESEGASVIDFSDQKKESYFTLGDGFSRPDATGVWTDGENCYLRINIPKSLLYKEIAGIIEFHTFLDQEFSLYWEDYKSGSWKFPHDRSLKKVHFTIPEKTNKTVTPILQFKIKHPKAPASYNLNKDQRRLGLFLRKISLFPNHACRESRETERDRALHISRP